MLIATDPAGQNFVVTRERGGEHGIELVDMEGRIKIVHSLSSFTLTYRERPIRSDRAVLANRPNGWLGDLRTARAKHICDAIAGKVKNRKVEKSDGSATPRPPAKPRVTKKALAAAQAEANRQQIEATLATLPPEIAALTRKNLGLPALPTT